MIVRNKKAAVQRPFAQSASEVEFFKGFSSELKKLNFISGTKQ